MSGAQFQQLIEAIENINVNANKTWWMDLLTLLLSFLFGLFTNVVYRKVEQHNKLMDKRGELLNDLKNMQVKYENLTDPLVFLTQNISRNEVDSDILLIMKSISFFENLQNPANDILRLILNKLNILKWTGFTITRDNSDEERKIIREIATNLAEFIKQTQETKIKKHKY